MKKTGLLIIAEAGVNHNGELGKALDLVDVAAEAGADIVKFQTFSADSLVTKKARMAGYQVENLGEEETQWQMLKKLELSESDYFEIQKRCESKGISFLSTGFDLESLKFLEKFEMGLWKIPSGEITNLPYLEFIGGLNKPTVVSTGMATMDEVDSAVAVLVGAGLSRENLIVLHCSTDYPADLLHVNLNAMLSMREHLGVEVGYSDHTSGIEVSIAAAALGAKVIEKHFTLSRDLPGPDHKASLEPHELKEMIRCVRNIELALGTSQKKPSDAELSNRLVARKSIVAGQDIREGEIYTTENLTVKRPGTGVSPMKWYEVIGKKAKKTFK